MTTYIVMVFGLLQKSYTNPCKGHISSCEWHDIIDILATMAPDASDNLYCYGSILLDLSLKVQNNIC